MNVEQIIQAIVGYKIASSKDIEAIRQRWFQTNRIDSTDGKAFAKWLILNKFLTEFQAQVLISGKLNALKVAAYNVLEIIKTGPYSGSLKVVCPLGGTFVLQFIKPEVLKDALAQKKFQEQLKNALELKHPNLASVVNSGVVNGNFYIVYEFFEGENLEVILLRKKKIPYQNAAKIMAFVMVGVAQLQEKKLPSGKLCSANVLLAVNRNQPKAAKTVKVVNTGISTSFISETVEITADGNIVPAAASSSDKLGDDLSVVEENFQVGKLFYAALTGVASTSLDGKTSPASVITLVSDIPEELANLADQMVSSNVSDRIAKIAYAAKAIRVMLAADDENESPRNEEYVAVPYTPNIADTRIPVVGTDDEPMSAKISDDGEESENEEFSIKKLMVEFKPDDRDMTFLGLGSVLSLLVVAFLHLITGWRFMSLVCLLVGVLISYTVELLYCWKNPSKS